MTAQPERVNLERVLRPAMPSTSEGRQHARTWRVVREDGSKASLHSEVLPPAKPSSPPAAVPVTAQVVPEPDSATISARQRLINLASLGFLGGNRAARESSGIDLSPPSTTPLRAGIGMPKVSPQLSNSSSSANQAGTEGAASVTGGSGPGLFPISATTTPRSTAKPRRPADPPTPAEAERDLQLMRVIDAWPALSLRAREAVVAVVEASCQR